MKRIFYCAIIFVPGLNFACTDSARNDNPVYEQGHSNSDKAIGIPSTESPRKTPESTVKSEQFAVIAVSKMASPGIDRNYPNRLPVEFESPEHIATVSRDSQSDEGNTHTLQISNKNNPERKIEFNKLVNLSDVAWSADGSKLAFCEGLLIWLVDANGENKTMIHAGPGGAYPGACNNLRWSTDGTKLHYLQIANANNPNISEPVRITLELGVRE